MVATDVGDDRLVHLVAAHAHGARIDDAAQRQHGDLGRAAADVDDHGARRLGHRQARADRGRHRLFDQEHAPRASRFGRFLNGAPLDGGGAGGHADDDLGTGEASPVVNLADEMLDHFLRHLEIGNDTVAQGPDGGDIARGSAQHHFRLVADGEHVFLALDLGNGDYRRLVQDDAPSLDVN
jgi:hypothetical protein